MRTDSGTRHHTRHRTRQNVIAGLSLAVAVVLTTAGCSEDAAEDQEITDVDDTVAPVDPTVEPVEPVE